MIGAITLLALQLTGTGVVDSYEVGRNSLDVIEYRHQTELSLMPRFPPGGNCEGRNAHSDYCDTPPRLLSTLIVDNTRLRDGGLATARDQHGCTFGVRRIQTVRETVWQIRASSHCETRWTGDYRKAR